MSGEEFNGLIAFPDEWVNAPLGPSRHSPSRHDQGDWPQEEGRKLMLDSESDHLRGPGLREERDRFKAERDHLLSACKQWKQATESRLRLLDSRGEAAKAMLKPDADLVAVIESMDGR